MRSSDLLPNGNTFLLWLGVLFFIAGGVIVYLVTDDPGPKEDEREVRQIGGLECVYNVTDDVVEACR